MDKPGPPELQLYRLRRALWMRLGETLESAEANWTTKELRDNIKFMELEGQRELAEAKKRRA